MNNSMKINLNRILIYLSWVPAVGYAFGIDIIVHVGIYLTFLVIALLTVKYRLLSRLQNIRRYIWLIVFVGLILLLLFYKLSLGQYELTRNTLYVIVLAMMINIQRDIGEVDLNLIVKSSLLVSLLFFILTVFYHGSRFDPLATELYLGYQNPNILANVLLIMTIFDLIGFYYRRKYVYLFGVLVCIYMIYRTDARTVLLAVVFLIISLRFEKIFKKRKVRELFNCFVMLTPILVIIFADFLERLFARTSGLTGRLEIWEGAINGLIASSQSFLVGKFKNVFPTILHIETLVIETEVTNANNIYLQMAWTVGVPLTVVFFYTLYKKLKYSSLKMSTKIGYIAYMGFFTTMLNSTMETHFVDGIIGMSVFTILLLNIMEYSEIHEYNFIKNA